MHNRSNSNINIICTDILYSMCNWEKVNSDILHLVNWYVVNCGLGNFSSCFILLISKASTLVLWT